MNEPEHAILIDPERCVGCVDCCKVCPTLAIRVRHDLAVVDPELCIDCGACLRACRYDAVRAQTSSQSDLKKFKYRVALPSLTLHGQFGRDVDPPQVLAALTKIGFDSTYDISWMCEMLAGATDAYLSEARGPWPKISVTCPAIVRLIQMRYPDLIPHLLPIETPRELAAKVIRRKLSVEKGLAAEDIGLFFITPCTAIMNSIVRPIGLEESYLDGAFGINEVYGRLLMIIKGQGPVKDRAPVSYRGLLWAMAGGEIAGMRSRNTMTVKGVRDVQYVFDHIEAGKFQKVDFIEAWICPDGCVSGQLTIEGRYAAQRSIQEIVKRLGDQEQVKEEKVRSLLRGHFFDLECRIDARPLRSLGRNLEESIARRREIDETRKKLPMKDCGACGAPSCAVHAEDVVRGESDLAGCVFVAIDQLREQLAGRKDGCDE